MASCFAMPLFNPNPDESLAVEEEINAEFLLEVADDPGFEGVDCRRTARTLLTNAAERQAED